jgi:hypothetical protein
MTFTPPPVEISGPTVPPGVLFPKRGLLLEQTEPQKDGCGSALRIWRSYIADSILHGMGFCRLDRLTRRWKGPYQSLVIGLAFQVGGGGRFWSEDAVVDRQPHEHDAIADAIERAPPEATARFDHRVSDFADDLVWL